MARRTSSRAARRAWLDATICAVRRAALTTSPEWLSNCGHQPSSESHCRTPDSSWLAFPAEIASERSAPTGSQPRTPPHPPPSLLLPVCAQLKVGWERPPMRPCVAPPHRPQPTWRLRVRPPHWPLSPSPPRVRPLRRRVRTPSQHVRLPHRSGPPAPQHVRPHH